jgi:hypothetical protein
VSTFYILQSRRYQHQRRCLSLQFPKESKNKNNNNKKKKLDEIREKIKDKIKSQENRIIG